MSKTYSIFISHSWDHSDDLEALHKLLNDRKYFCYESMEATKFEPIDSENAKYIKSVLKRRIEDSNMVLALAGIYASHSDWMKWEIETAKSLGIPIVGVIPRGQQRISQVVFVNSIADVRWSTESIVQAIRDHAK